MYEKYRPELKAFAINPVFVRALGGYIEAVLVDRVDSWCYWNCQTNQTDVYRDGHWWVYQTYDEWRMRIEYTASVSTIRRKFDKLEKMGVIVSGCYNKKKYDRTKWYRIDKAKLDEYIKPYLTDCSTKVKSENPCVQNEQLTTVQSEQMRTAQNEQTNTIYIKTKKRNNKNNMAVTPPVGQQPNVKVNAKIEAKVDEVLQYLNEVAGKKLRLKSEANRKPTRARLREASVDDLKHVIDVKASEWLNAKPWILNGKQVDPKQYLKPSTLFSPKHFEDYLQQYNDNPAKTVPEESFSNAPKTQTEGVDINDIPDEELPF